jgi:HAMP domain-containing protein
MTEPRQPPLPAGPDRPPGGGPPGAGRRLLTGVAVLAAVIAGTALLGVAAGFLWSAVAPRALVVVLGPGTPYTVNPETSAYIAADGWFTLLTVVGGVISGLLGYALAVRRRGALAMAGVLVGGAVAALLAKWIGQQSGAAAYSHSLAAGRPGALLQEPLMLGGLGALAFWPLAAGLVVGGIEVVSLLRERRLATSPRQAVPPSFPNGPAAGPGPADATEHSPGPG